MVFLIIALVLLALFAIYIVLVWNFIRKAHAELFNHRQEIDPLIDSYTYEEFGLNREKKEIIYEGKKIVGYFYFDKEYDKSKLIVYCHGMWSSKEAYMQEIGHIAKNGFKVFAFDYFGTNESDGSLMGFGNSILSLDLVLNDLEKEYQNIYCIGHSWGGFAVTNIVKYHPNLKGIVGLAPLTGIFNHFAYGHKRYPLIISNLFVLYDKLKTGKYGACNSIKSLKKYNGKVLIIQSNDDQMVSYRSSLALIEKKLPNKNNIEYLKLTERGHQPQYTVEAVRKLAAFEQSLRSAKDQEEALAIYKQTDFRQLGNLDMDVYQKIIEFFLKINRVEERK